MSTGKRVLIAILAVVALAIALFFVLPRGPRGPEMGGGEAVPMQVAPVSGGSYFIPVDGTGKFDVKLQPDNGDYSGEHTAYVESKGGAVKDTSSPHTSRSDEKSFVLTVYAGSEPGKVKITVKNSKGEFEKGAVFEVDIE